MQKNSTSFVNNGKFVWRKECDIQNTGKGGHHNPVLKSKSEKSGRSLGELDYYNSLYLGLQLYLQL